jgi:tetratricopeptide (TPR) repeat protein
MANLTLYRSIAAMWIALLPILALAGEDTAKPAPDSIEWKTSLDSAIKVAADSSWPVLADFYTDWCKWCKIQDESTFTDSRVIAMTRTFIFARLNAEVDTAKAREFGVNGYPTVILLDKTGREVDRLLGYNRPAEFVKTVENYLRGVGTKAAIEAEVRQKPQDLKLKYALAEKHVGRGEFDQARSLFQQILNTDPKNGSGVTDKAVFEMAVLHRKEKNWYKAIEGFRRFIKAYPKSDLREDAETYIPWLHAKAGDTKEALKYYRAFLKSFSGSSQADWVKEQIKLLENPSDSSSS